MLDYGVLDWQGKLTGYWVGLESVIRPGSISLADWQGEDELLGRVGLGTSTAKFEVSFTVEPPNKGQIGIRASVFYSEAVFIGKFPIFICSAYELQKIQFFISNEKCLTQYR